MVRRPLLAFCAGVFILACAPFSALADNMDSRAAHIRTPEVTVLLGPQPSVANSTIPCAVKLVCRNATTTSSNHTVHFVIRDATNVGIPATVRIDFNGCDSTPSTIQNGPHGEASNCPLGDIHAQTAADGTLDMDLQGMASAAAIAQLPNSACVAVWANTTFMGFVQVATFDLDGRLGGLGVTAGDLSQFLIYALSPNCAGPSPNYCPIVDYDYLNGGCSAQDVSAADLAMYLDEALSGASAFNDVSCF